MPVGADREQPVDIRLIGAAHENLAARVAEGKFRPDLFYRLSVVRVVIPPLRARREDLATMTAELLRRRGFAAGAVAGPNLELLFAHDWPGNGRELRNVLERALVLSPDATDFAALKLSLEPGGASEDPLAVRTDLPFADAKRVLLDAFERKYLRDLLARTDGNVSAAAREAGLDRKHLRSLAKRYGLL
jgi:DNA-binding NtrC family response regulator